MEATAARRRRWVEFVEVRRSFGKYQPSPFTLNSLLSQNGSLSLSLSICSSHRGLGLQVNSWRVPGGGERWWNGRGSEGEEQAGERPTQSSLEKDYCFLSLPLSSPLTGEGSCRWGRGWFLEVESDGGRQGRGAGRRKKVAVGFSQEKKTFSSFSLLGYRFFSS